MAIDEAKRMRTPTTPGAPTVNHGAPVVSSAEGEIDASIDDVWAILTAIERWPVWNPDVRSVSIEGPAVEGTTFSWKAGPGTITSTVVRVEPRRLIAWTGSTLGIRAIHTWHLEQRDGGTRVWTEESYEGLVGRVLQRTLEKKLHTALADGVRHLEAEAERATSSSRLEEKP